MLDIHIYIENSDITILIKNEKYDEALAIIETRLSKNDIPLENNAHLLLLKAHCNYKLERYPIAINSLNQITKYRYGNEIEQHVLSQAFYIKAQSYMAHSKGMNKTKNRSTFIAISSCLNLLTYREDILNLMDDFLILVGEK
jgi:tetratricopeptide (TPR) repeat protein